MKFNFENFIKSKEFKLTLFTLIGFVVLVVVFAAGMLFGFNRARFSSGIGLDYYSKISGQPKLQAFTPDNHFANPYGAAGAILLINNNSLTIENQGSNIEEKILIDPSTIIKKGSDQINVNDLKVGDQIISIGEPQSNSNGQMSAKFIRVLSNNQ